MFAVVILFCKVWRIPPLFQLTVGRVFEQQANRFAAPLEFPV